MAAAWIQRTLRFSLGRGCLSVWTDIEIDSGEALQNSRNELLYQPARGPAAERCGEPIVARCISDWLSKEVGLPVISRFPEIKPISSGAIDALWALRPDQHKGNDS
jgi:hypothetical protein